MGFSELLAKSDVDSKHKRHLEMIHKSAARCQKIVQNLLSFARHHQPERKLVCVNKLIEDASDILQYQMRTSNIQLIMEVDPNLPKAMVDPHQMQQVFLNLINNSRQAIEEFRPNGWIRVRTEVSGENVRILIRDNGPGISAENISKIFDPFFTTKMVGKGTGLGLSLCYGIIKEHGGSIHASSKLGSGAAFVIELPIAVESGETISDQEILLPDKSDEGTGRKVLVIDDEELILQMVSEVLGRCGYEVDVAGDGETALNRMRYGSYDLALCDWKMPGLNGQQVYERLRSINPVMSERMIFITGDVINVHTQNFLRERNKVCLSKPFSVAEFRTAITQALARQ
jgi:two-component system NtrC family sensor kinase